MKKFFLLIIINFILLSACGSGGEVKINGHLYNLKDSVIVAVFNQNQEKRVVDIYPDSYGHFSYSINKGTADYLTLFFNSKTDFVTVYFDKAGKYEVKGDAQKPSTISVKGGHINEDLRAFQKANKEIFEERLQLLDQQSLKETETDVQKTINMRPVSSKLANLDVQLKGEVEKYIRNNPKKVSSLVLIEQYYKNVDSVEKMDELLTLIDPELNDNYLYRELISFSRYVRRTEPGSAAPDFEVNDVYGNALTLDSLTDNYLLLTFSAPWCDLCLPEDLYLKEIREMYPESVLTMLTVTLDETNKGVKEAAKRDAVDWSLVADSVGQAAMMIDLYGVSSLPRCFIIDKDKKVLLRTDNGYEIKQFLRQLLGDK